MVNKWATPSLVLGIAAVAAFPINIILPAGLGALATVFGSLGVRQDTKRVRSLIGMILGFLTFAFSGLPVGF